MAQSGRQGKVTLFLFECFAILAVLSPDSGSFDMHPGYAHWHVHVLPTMPTCAQNISNQHVMAPSSWFGTCFSEMHDLHIYIEYIVVFFGRVWPCVDCLSSELQCLCIAFWG